MRVKILGGAGAVGEGVATDPLRNREVEQLGIADINADGARSIATALNDKRVYWEKVDADDEESLKRVMDREYIIANCIGPHYKYCRKIAEAAVEAGASYCDICDDYDAAEALLCLDERAKEADVTLIPCLGAGPGVTNMLAKRGSAILDKTTEAEPVSAFRVEVSGGKEGKYRTVTYTGTNKIVTTTARSLSVGVQMLGKKTDWANRGAAAGRVPSG